MKTPQTPKAPVPAALGQDAAKAEADQTPSTQPPAAALADALPPGPPHDERLSMLADRPPKDATIFQK